MAWIGVLGIMLGACQALSGLSGYHETSAGGTSSTASGTSSSASSGAGGIGGASTSTSSTTSTGAGGGCDAGCAATPGSVLWAQSLSAMAPTGVAQGSAGVVVVGYFAAPTQLGGSLLVPAGGENTAFAEYTTGDAGFEYQNSFGGAGQVYGFLLDLGPSGAPIVYGVAYGATYDLGLGPVDGGNSPAAPDGFVGQYAVAGPPVWVRRLVGPGQFVAAVDGPNSTVFAAGWFEQTTVLEQTPDAPVTLTAPASGSEILLAQFNVYTGAPVMHQVWGASVVAKARGMVWTVSKTVSQLVMIGDYNGTITFGSTAALTSPGGNTAWVAALTAAGVPVWSVSFGGTGDLVGGKVVADAAGDLYVCGTFTDQATFGTNVLVSAGATDVFVAKLDGTNGDVVWATSFGSIGKDSCQGLALDPSGHLFVAAAVQGPLSPGGPSYGGYDAAIVAFESTGQPRWTQVIGTSGDDFGYAVTAPSGALFATVALGGDIGPSVAGTPIGGAAATGGLLLKMQP